MSNVSGESACTQSSILDDTDADEKMQGTDIIFSSNGLLCTECGTEGFPVSFSCLLLVIVIIYMKTKVA